MCVHTVYKKLVVCGLTGSGSLAAMAVFESRYRPNMEVNSLELFLVSLCMWYIQVDEAKQLVHDAIAGGIFNDLVTLVMHNMA